jgi:hypothetical protein
MKQTCPRCQKFHKSKQQHCLQCLTEIYRENIPSNGITHKDTENPLEGANNANNNEYD